MRRPVSAFTQVLGDARDKLDDPVRVDERVGGGELGKFERDDDGIGGSNADRIVGVSKALRRSAVEEVFEILHRYRMQV